MIVQCGLFHSCNTLYNYCLVCYSSIALFHLERYEDALKVFTAGHVLNCKSFTIRFYKSFFFGESKRFQFIMIFFQSDLF